MSSLYDQLDSKADYCSNKCIYINLTDLGLRKVTQYIEMLNNENKRILSRKKDTFYETILPDINDIMQDIFWTEEDGEYAGMWHVSDNIFADKLLKLSKGKDYFLTKLGEAKYNEVKKCRAYFTQSLKNIVNEKYKLDNEETVVSELKNNPSHYVTVSDSNGYLDVEIKRSADNQGYIIDVWHKDDLIDTMTIWDDIQIKS